MRRKQLLNAVFGGKYSRRIILVTFDMLCFAVVTVMYYFLAKRAYYSVPVDNLPFFLGGAGIQLTLVMLSRLAFSCYRNVWRYANTKAYLELVLSDVAGGLLSLLLIRSVNRWLIPGFYCGLWQPMILGAFSVLLALLSRFVYNFLYRFSTQNDYAASEERRPAAIVGAGRLGAALAAELKESSRSAYTPLFFIDTDRTKINYRVEGLRVYAPEEGSRLIRELGIRDVIIAISDKKDEDMQALYRHYSDLNCRVRVYDSPLSVNTSAEKNRPVLRDFTVEDLLFRNPIKINNSEAARFYSGKTVLVTGGGGSIGSELCRQLAACGPKRLILFDIYENNAYDIQQELRRRHDILDLQVEIGSVRDAERVRMVFEKYRPEIVFHAAAHKHVPLMESSACEAVKNNVFGTLNVVNAAEDCGTGKFIMISTDKAVNPTNIMGASKRMCEMIVQSRTDSRTSFAAVRFGNVLGSNGSVIPLFKRQIAEGGPVTVTDKRIIRYFMTIPEASQLVMQAGAMAGSGELYVLDMGKPVKIYDLARDMIRLSGLEPDVDIEIREVGLRPGEKLYEELLMKNEKQDKTDNDRIFVERDEPLSREAVEEKLAVLQEALEASRGKADCLDIMKAAFAKVVPTYRQPEEVNRDSERSEEMKLANEK